MVRLSEIQGDSHPAGAVPPSDSVIIYDASGTEVWHFDLPENDPANPEGGNWYISSATLADPAQYGNATALVHPDGTYSDLFGVILLQDNYYIGFASDTEDAPPSYPQLGTPQILILEVGGYPYDMTMYLATEWRADGYRITFTSDSDEIPPVPEPSVLAVLGLAGLALRKRRS